MIGRGALVDAWYRRGAGERTAWVVLAALVVAVIAVFAVIVPLSGAVARMRADTARVEALVSVARAHRAIDDALARAAPAPQVGAPSATVASTLAGHGLVPLAPPRSADDGSVELIVASAPFDALVRTLGALAHDDGLYVERAVLTRLADGQSVRVELALRPGATH